MQQLKQSYLLLMLIHAIEIQKKSLENASSWINRSSLDCKQMHTLYKGIIKTLEAGECQIRKLFATQKSTYTVFFYH